MISPFPIAGIHTCLFCKYMDCVLGQVNAAMTGFLRYINPLPIEHFFDAKKNQPPSIPTAKEKYISHFNHPAMCIHYNIEFWSPFDNPSAEAERRVLRGIERPGRNPRAKKMEFWEHDGQFLKRPVCRNPREGGYYYNRIFEFCFDDVACGERLDHFEHEYDRCQRASEESEQRREPQQRQRMLAQAWLDAYHNWISGYESHKDCPRTRNRHEHFNALNRAGVCVGMYGLPDHLRIGKNPHTVVMPSVGIERGARSSGPRR